MATKTDLGVQQGHQTASVQDTDPEKGKVTAPDKFFGKRSDWKLFMSCIKFYFISYPKAHPTGAKKILFIVSHLGDSAAYKYIQNYAHHFEKPLKDQPKFINDYELFAKTMHTSFGDAQPTLSQKPRFRNCPKDPALPLTILIGLLILLIALTGMMQYLSLSTDQDSVPESRI